MVGRNVKCTAVVGRNAKCTAVVGRNAKCTAVVGRNVYNRSAVKVKLILCLPEATVLIILYSLNLTSR